MAPGPRTSELPAESRAAATPHGCRRQANSWPPLVPVPASEVDDEAGDQRRRADADRHVGHRGVALRGVVEVSRVRDGATMSRALRLGGGVLSPRDESECEPYAERREPNP